MSRIGDFLIGMQEDAECVSASCDSFEKFVKEMRKLNILYTPSLLEGLLGWVCKLARRAYVLAYVLLIANRQSFGLYKQ
jgi:hypothetical protein